MEADEVLGTGATISMVLYANINHPEWKTEFPGIIFASILESKNYFYIIWKSLLLVTFFIKQLLSTSKFSHLAWPDRHKQIQKKWRALPAETKAPYLTQARENRAANRMKKTQQVSVGILLIVTIQ